MIFVGCTAAICGFCDSFNRDRTGLIRGLPNPAIALQWKKLKASSTRGHEPLQSPMPKNQDAIVEGARVNAQEATQSFIPLQSRAQRAFHRSNSTEIASVFSPLFHRFCVENPAFLGYKLHPLNFTP
jgi:hypothetical protein